ncbi:hypothetical protein Mapa_000960 [Marchantia paleacea]|nr:hypothetical protein Mapa_000960 [Marchantia paleacea]
MSMLVGVRGQSRESEGAALREGIIQQPGPFYNGNPSSIIWGTSTAAPLWRDENSAYSTSSSPFSSVQQQQQRVQEEETEKDVGMNVAAGETRAATKGSRRHVARNYVPRTSNPTAPASSPFAFGFPPQPNPGPVSAPAAGLGQPRIPSAGTSGSSFVAFGAGVNFAPDASSRAGIEPAIRPGVVLSAQDERMEDIEEVVPAMSNLSVNEQGNETRLHAKSAHPTTSHLSVQDVSPSWGTGSDVSEKFSALGLNCSSETSGERTDAAGVFVFVAQTTSNAFGSAPPKPAVVTTPAVSMRPRVKVKRSGFAAKGKGIAAGNGPFSVPSPMGLDGYPSVIGECSFSSPSFGPSAVQDVKSTFEDPRTQDLPSSSSLPMSASQDSLMEGVHQSWSERSSPSRSGRNAVFVEKSWISRPPEELGTRTKSPFVAEKIFKSEEFDQATARGCDILLPSAFSRVGSSGKGPVDESCSSTQSLNASFAGVTFSNSKSKEMSGKHGLASGHADIKAHLQPVEDLISGFARKLYGGSGGIASDKAPKIPGLSNSRNVRPAEDNADVSPASGTGFRQVIHTVGREAGGNLNSTSSPPTESVEQENLHKQPGIENQKPYSDYFPRVPSEPFVFGASWSHQPSTHPEVPSPSTPFKFGAKVNSPSPCLSSSTGGGCVGRSASISVSDLLDLKHKNSAAVDGSFTPHAEADAVTSSFSSFNLGASNSSAKLDIPDSIRFPFTGNNKSTVETPVASGANAASADSVDGDPSSSSYSTAPSHFVFSAGSGSTSSTSPTVPGHQGSSGSDAAAVLDKKVKEGMFQPLFSAGPVPTETQQSSQPSHSNSSNSFEFRASSGSSKGASSRKKGNKTHTMAPRRPSRSLSGSKDKKNVGGSFMNFASANGPSVVPDDTGSPMDFSPQRFIPPDGFENGPDLEQTSKSWSQRSQSLEKEGADGDDEWAQYSETDMAMDNLRTAAMNLTLGKEDFCSPGKENSPSKATGKNGKWKRAPFDDSQTPLSGRDNNSAEPKVDIANDCDSAASSSSRSVDSSASSSGYSPYKFSAGSQNFHSTTTLLKRHAPRNRRDKLGAGSGEAGRNARTRGENVGTTDANVPKQSSVLNAPAAGLTSNAQRPVFSFDSARETNIGDSEKGMLGRTVSGTGVSNKGPSVMFTARASSWSTEPSSTMGPLPRTDGAGPTSPRSSGAAATEQVCEKWRLRGNQAYANGDFPKAEEYYSRGASSVPPNETSQSCIRASMLCYSNRAATRMVVGRMREALADCMRAMAVDPNFLRVRLRAASCHLALGEIDAAEAAYKECLRRAKDDSQPDTKVSQESTEGLRKTLQVREYLDRALEILENWSSGDVATALRLLNEALLSSPHSERALELKACVLLLLRKYDEVVQLCELSLASAERNHAAVSVESSTHQVPQGSQSQLGGYALKVWRWQLNARAKFHLGRLEEALELLQKLDEVASCHKTTSFSSSLNAESTSLSILSIRDLLRHKAAGNEAFQAGKHAEAVEHYTAALACNGDSRPFNAVCLCNRAAASQALGHIGDAIADCSRAIALDPKYAKAISRRATLHEKVRDYGQCCHDLQRLITLLESQQQQVRTTQVGPGRLGRSTNSTQDLRQARERLAKAEDEMKKGHPLDHYMILGLEPACSSTEIKKAYKKAALRHHPDKAGQFLARSEGGDDGGLWKEVGDEVRREAERLFKLIGEAYAILSDPQKRLRYDQDEDIRKLRTRASGATGLSEIYRSAERAGVGRKPRERWDSWSSGHSYGQHQRWQSGPDAAQPDTYARRGSGRYGSNSSSRTTGDGGTEYDDWD